MTVATARVQSLEAAIQQQINLGNRDPLTIVNNLIRLYGEEELVGWLDVRALVFDAAARQLGNIRRGAEARARQHTLPSEQLEELTRKAVWIDGKGYVDYDDLTEEDCLVRAEHHRKLAGQNLSKAAFYESLAAAIRAAGVKTLGDVPEHLRLEVAA